MKRNLLQYRHSREITVSGTTTTRQNSANEFGSVLTSPNRTQKKKKEEATAFLLSIWLLAREK